MTRYVSAEKLVLDDFGVRFTGEVGEVVYDAMIKTGQWATMTESSFQKHSKKRLGTGFGQKYVRNSSGELHKVEG